MWAEPETARGDEAPSEELLNAAVSRARSFLEREQRDDGRWLDFREGRNISSSWVTAYIGTQLLGEARDSRAGDRAMTWLLTHAYPTGGWGYNLATRPDADTIANVIHLLLARDTVERTAAQAVELLDPFFLPDVGGFRTYLPTDGEYLHGPGSSWCTVHPCVTAMCALALAAVDILDERVRASVAYLGRRQREDGLFDAFWWDGVAYATYHAARLLHLAGHADQVARAKAGLVAEAHDHGGWSNRPGEEPSAFHTAFALRTLAIASDEREQRTLTTGLSRLLAMQDSDGGFPAVPVLRVPTPDVHAPRGTAGEALVPTLRDRNRLFATATALSALCDGRSVLYP